MPGDRNLKKTGHCIIIRKCIFLRSPTSNIRSLISKWIQTGASGNRFKMYLSILCKMDLSKLLNLFVQIIKYICRPPTVGHWSSNEFKLELRAAVSIIRRTLGWSCRAKMREAFLENWNKIPGQWSSYESKKLCDWNMKEIRPKVSLVVSNPVQRSK